MIARPFSACSSRADQSSQSSGWESLATEGCLPLASSTLAGAEPAEQATFGGSVAGTLRVPSAFESAAGPTARGACVLVSTADGVCLLLTADGVAATFCVRHQGLDCAGDDAEAGHGQDDAVC